MKTRSIPLLLLCCLLLISGIAVPQAVAPAPAAKNPTLGLVLEGGGALGLAHIGVLLWLEQHRIPVSYVAGTSMGGLVGGLYATGRSATEVEVLVNSIPWNDVLRGEVPFQDLTFRRKEDAHEFPTSLEFGLRKGVHFPAGFNSGEQVSLILDQVALPYSQIKSFNDLPIPFACVATDLATGKAHVFHDGSLEVALRSTMSLPGIFTPVHSNGHIYVDGGLLNNIPIDVARQMGADVVLGVHLEVAALNPKTPLSSVGVLGQSISVVIAANELRSMEQADLLISVPLEKYTSTDYNKAQEIIQAGYNAAAAKANVLERFSVDEAAWQQYLSERNARRKTTPVPQFVQVTGTNPAVANDIEKRLKPLVGKPVDIKALDQQMIKLSGMGRFSSVGYSMTEQNGQPGLKIHTNQKSYAPPMVRPLILIDGSDYNNVLFSIGARITFLDFGGFRSELRNDVIVGSQYLAASEYYRPFTPNSNWFVAPRGEFNSEQYNLYSSSSLIASYRLRQELGGVDVGRIFGTTGELRVGYEGGHEHLFPKIGQVPDFPTTSGAVGDMRVQYRINTLDDPVIPNQGQSLIASNRWFNVAPDATGNFSVSEIQSQNFFQLSRPSTVFASAYGGTSYGRSTGIPAFSLGGTQRLVAWNTNELLTNQYFLGQVGYIRKLVNLPPFLGSTIDFLGGYEAGKTYKLANGPVPPNLPMDGFGGIVVNTIFGPVEIGGAVGDYGRGRAFFRVGRIF